MQNRMDKYSVNPKSIGSRTEKNKALYESVRNSSMKNYEIKSNVSIIDDDASSINVGKVRKMIDERYNESSPKRKSIEIPEFANSVPEEKIQDTKEYDINAILAKAKVGKNVDYNKERLKKVRDTQYEILNNLDLELKKEEIQKKTKSQEDAENNLMNLINTITELEIKNKNKHESDDLLSDLMDDPDEIPEQNKEDEEETTNEVRLVKESNKDDKKDQEIKPKEEKVQTQKVEEKNKESKHTDYNKKDEEHIEKTLSKLDINMSNYDDFADISKGDGGSLIIKIVIFIIIIVLVLGAIYILNDILNLGLF